MLELKTARKLVDTWLEERRKNVRAGLVIVDERTITKPYGWVFQYDSPLWLETHDLQHAIGGNGPVVVLAATGEIVPLGTHRPVAEMIETFERERGLRA